MNRFLDRNRSLLVSGIERGRIMGSVFAEGLFFVARNSSEVKPPGEIFLDNEGDVKKTFPPARIVSPLRRGGDPLAEWHSMIVTVVEKLRCLVGTSEKEFLQIGEQMQAVYQNSFEISQTASQLVETASGQNSQLLSTRLRQMAADMESFLARFHSRSTRSFSVLNYAQELLSQLDGPLEDIRKLTKTFYMLEVSIKIESARLGDLGNEFSTLAMDIKRLSQQACDKLGAIKEHRDSLFTMITNNLGTILHLSSAEEENARHTLHNTLSNLHELDSVHERFTCLGSTISNTFNAISSSVGEVVSSLQFHDINRQQLEHIVEALERLMSDISSARNNGLDDASRHTLIVESGDACELQQAQLQFASSELYAAVSTIIESLRDIVSKQSTIQHQTMSASGVTDEAGTYFIDAISGGLSTTAALLNTSAGSHHEMSGITDKMASGISVTSSMVNEIDKIGYSTIKTALNAQIKAEIVGAQGVVLATLAGEIRRLSDDLSKHTAAISMNFSEISSVTTNLINETHTDEIALTAWLTTVDKEIHEIMDMLGDMKGQIHYLVTAIQDKITSLAEDIEKITAHINVHEWSKTVAEEVITMLGVVVAQSRKMFPVSSEFKKSLQKMNAHYTMESERRVHHAIASRHGVALELAGQNQMSESTGGESEFGDNVDLF